MMTMENLTNEMLQNYMEALESEAKKEVLETLGVDDIKMVFNYGCGVGVSGFIYYYETEAFFKKYTDEVLECFQDLTNEFGEVPLSEITQNNLTWLFVEETVREMAYSLDLE